MESEIISSKLIRMVDHKHLRKLLTKKAKPEDKKAKEALESDDYFEVLKTYDEQLQKLTEKIWQNEYLNV